MSRTLVLHPECTFRVLCNILVPAGWQIVSESAQPILPGEPEYAVFEPADSRGADRERVHYSFNPACQLRLIEVDPAGARALPPLQTVDASTVSGWLTGPDERTLLRGLLAARHVAEPALLPRVVAQSAHPRTVIANVASREAETLRRVLGDSTEPAKIAERQARARVDSLAAIEVLKQQLEPLLRMLARDPDGTVAATLQPRPDDYAHTFLPQFADAARRAYETVWTQHPRVDPVPADSVLETHVAPGGMLADENELSFLFPGGYRQIATLLNPHRVWVRWKYLRPGAAAGQSYDGLVWLDNHWAWFPKPYRVLRDLVRTGA